MLFCGFDSGHSVTTRREGLATRSFQMLHRMIIAAAWASIAVIAYATLSRVGTVYNLYERVAPLVNRPSISSYVHYEHVLAFAVAGLLFGVAYPRSTILVCCIVLGAAALLEILQTLTPDRHGTLFDALEKMAGGATGILVARTVMRFHSERRL
jgi:VanZ family protein